MVFSDESTVQILDERTQHVRRRPGEEFKKECLVERVKHAASIMVWSSISVHGPGRLQVVSGTMNSEKYTNVLENALKPQIAEWFGDEEYIFQQDNAPCHVSKRMKDYFLKQKMTVLPWPGNSPDMNPIEGIWGIMKRKINEIEVPNKRLLIERLIKVWHHDDELKSHCRKFIEGMPKRLQALIKAKGGHTKY